MTLQSFALATLLRRPSLAGGEPALMRKVDLADRLSAALRGAGGDRSTPLVGAGLCLVRDALFPTVLVKLPQVDDVHLEPQPLSEFPEVVDAISGVLNALSVQADDLRLLPVDGGRQASGPGTDIKSSGKRGRIGAHVKWGSREGFLTAGHVASGGSSVYDLAGNLLGTVVWSDDPAAPTSKPARAVDVALVEFAAGFAAVTGRSAAIVGAGDPLVITSTAKACTVLGYWAHLTIGGYLYRDCFSTRTHISVPGDSGGEVESSGDVAGIVVGDFTRRGMTIVQSIDFQVTEVHSGSGFFVTL